MTVSGSARSTGAPPLRERATGTQRPRTYLRVSQSVGRDGSSWAVPSVRRLRKNARRKLCNPQGEHSRRGTGCFGSRVTGACSLPAPVSRKRRVTVGPSCHRHDGTQEAADRQRRAVFKSRWRASQEARRERLQPSGWGHSSLGPFDAFRGVEQAGLSRRLVCLKSHRRVWPR